MSVTGTVVRTWFSTAKLPIVLAESTLHRSGRRDEWPPLMAFDAFEAGAKQVIGSIIRDQQLANEGRLERERVARLRAATGLELLAESIEEEADAEFAARTEADEARLREIDEQAEARRQAEADKLRREKQQAHRKAARKAKTAAEAEAASDKAVAKVDRAARAARVGAEKDAVAKERRAVAAKKSVQKIDEELESTKAARKAQQP